MGRKAYIKVQTNPEFFKHVYNSKQAYSLIYYRLVKIQQIAESFSVSKKAKYDRDIKRGKISYHGMVKTNATSARSNAKHNSLVRAFASVDGITRSKTY